MLTSIFTIVASLLLAVTAHAGEPVAGHLAYSINSNAQFTNYSQSGQRLEYVVLQPWEVDRMRALKAANPNLKVLLYENLLASEQGRTDNGSPPTPVSYEEANTTHPDWFLKNTSGQRFTLRGYPYQWAMDIGNSGYQQRWTENVIASVEANGWDGVFIDNVNPTIKYYANVSSVAKYPTDAAYAASTLSALKAITPRLQATHMLVFANFGSWSDYYTTVTPWLKYVDGAMDEMFVKFGSTPGAGYRNEAEWTRQLNELKETERQGKVFLAITHSANTDEAAALFGWASVLLGANGSVGYELGNTYADETWFPEYEYDIGLPLSAESQDPNGVHRRVFTNGLVLANPTEFPQAVAFGGTYSGSGLAPTTGVTMAPHSGLVLLLDSAQIAPVPSTPSLQPTPTSAEPLLPAATVTPASPPHLSRHGTKRTKRHHHQVKARHTGQ